MGLSCRYQAVVLDPGRSGAGAILRSTFLRRCSELGLQTGECIDALDEESYRDRRNLRAPIAGVYIGPGETETCTKVAEALIRAGAPVLPLVPQLDGYKKQVPSCLHRLNAQKLEPSDTQLERAASWLLEELALLRKQRLAFISYRRGESITVAQQIYRALDACAFRVFLDTHSIRYGAPFQEVINDRMADADILIFLDTPGALDSKWVEQEFSLAHNLGLGVLHVIWPGHHPIRETELNNKIYLQNTDFRNSESARLAEQELQDDTISQIVTSSEAIRARTLAARRTRVIHSFQRLATERGLNAVVGPEHFVEIFGQGESTARAYPIVGHPDAHAMQQVHQVCPPGLDASLIFDPSGLQPTAASHLGWLNQHVPIKAVALSEVEQWLTKLAAR